MQTILYFIRHGDVENPNHITYGRVFDFALSSLGQKQVRQISSSILERHEKPDIFYVSPLLRTRQTAIILTDEIGHAPIIIRDELLETDSYGLVGLPFGIVYEKGDVYKCNSAEFHLEAPEEQVQRMKIVYEEASSVYKGKIIFIVSHGDPITFLIDSLLRPNMKLRSIVELRKEIMLPNGGAWRIVLDEKNSLVHAELLKPTILS